jgi:uncharacterized membrane protein YdjX (TVP38/TMEM64 family)
MSNDIGFWQHVRTLLPRQRLLWLVGLGIGAAVVLWQARQYIDLTPSGVRALIEPLGWWGAALLAIMIAGILVFPIIPATLLQVGAGVVYGPWVGFVVALCGDMLGASAGFAVARRWGREFLMRRLSVAEAASFDALSARVTPINIVLLRILPGPAYTLVSFAAGCAPIGWARYLASSVIGVIPALALLTLAGDLSTRNPWLAGGVGVVFVCVMVLLNKVAHKYNKSL